MAGLFGPVPLTQYLDLVGALPLPTHEQKENFAEYVSHAHSWYKHLSVYPPGTSFHFFLDPHAGCDRRHGTTSVVDRTKPGFHYNQIPTAVYRRAFGYLAYSYGSRNTVPLVVPAAGETAVIASTSRMRETRVTDILVYGIPTEIFEVGAAWLTGAMHTLSAAMPWVWDTSRQPNPVDWPAESGGLGALDRIVEHCRIQNTTFWFDQTRLEQWPLKEFPHSDHHVACVDPVLYELLAPERRRQRGQIIQAIDRVCAVIEKQKSGQH